MLYPEEEHNTGERAQARRRNKVAGIAGHVADCAAAVAECTGCKCPARWFRWPLSARRHRHCHCHGHSHLETNLIVNQLTDRLCRAAATSTITSGMPVRASSPVLLIMQIKALRPLLIAISPHLLGLYSRRNTSVPRNCSESSSALYGEFKRRYNCDC